MGCARPMCYAQTLRDTTAGLLHVDYKALSDDTDFARADVFLTRFVTIPPDYLSLASHDTIVDLT